MKLAIGSARQPAAARGGAGGRRLIATPAALIATLAALAVAASCASAGSSSKVVADEAATDGVNPDLDLALAAITAAGTETPRGLTWGDQGDQRAAALFKNVKVLGDASGTRFMAAMQSMQPNLGVKCAHCHEEAARDFASDAKAAKLATRRMIDLTFVVNRSGFDHRAGVTCFTCHRGRAVPEKAAFAGSPAFAAARTPLPELSAEDAKRPAEQVWKNIRGFTGVPAGRIPAIMGWFTTALGVSCAHCHVDGSWESDELAPKRRAREMMKLVGLISRTAYASGQSPVTCATCHRGQAKPPRVPGEAQATAAR